MEKELYKGRASVQQIQIVVFFLTVVSFMTRLVRLKTGRLLFPLSLVTLFKAVAQRIIEKSLFGNLQNVA